MRTDHLTPTTPAPDRENYLLALTALVGSLSTKQARVIHKASFVLKYGVDPDTIRALVQLDCLEQAKATPGNYRALSNLFQVTPEEVMARLAAMKGQPEVQPTTVATKPVDDKPAKQTRQKKAEPIRETYTVHGPTDAELATVVSEVNERLSVTIKKVVDEPEPETPLERATESLARNLTEHLPEPEASQRKEDLLVEMATMNNDPIPAADRGDFIERLYDLKRLYLKASHALTDLAGILSEIDHLEQQLN